MTTTCLSRSKPGMFARRAAGAVVDPPLAAVGVSPEQAVSRAAAPSDRNTAERAGCPAWGTDPPHVGDRAIRRGGWRPVGRGAWSASMIGVARHSVWKGLRRLSNRAVTGVNSPRDHPPGWGRADARPA